jgi:hypothetical protein
LPKPLGPLLRALPVLLASLAATAPALAQTQARDFTTYRPSTPATHIAASEAPNIDGDISDAVWKKAPLIDEFYQLEPNEGRPTTDRTEVRVLYDENNIYFSIMAYEDPKIILGRVKSRDGNIDVDDVFRVYLDPNMTRRNGYEFEVSPVGARRDALTQNNTDFLIEWNAIWSAKSRILSNGWSSEIAIPFRSISYDPNRHDWGFDLFRLIRSKNERVRWSSINKAIQSVDISHSGTLTGISGINEGLGLEVKGYALARYQHNWDAPAIPSPKSGVSLRPSANAYYKITPSLTGTLTYNTDFSDAPLDQRQVNISRFSIFYPERRDFFLQDASAFEFGGQVLHDDPNARPFVSRRIGIVAGNPVNLEGGAKISGTYGDIGLGALTVQTARGAFSDPQLLSAARATAPIFDESKIGFIYTNGDPRGLSHNYVGGGDVQLQTSTWWPGNIVKFDAMYERSHSTTFGNDDAWGFEASLPNEPFNGFFRFKQVGTNFAPALGFVARPGIREYNGNFVWKARYEDSFARWTEAGTWFDIFTGLDNRLQSRLQGAWVDAFTNDGDFVLLEDWVDYENTDAFTLPHGVLVPSRKYNFDVAHFRVETAASRPVSAFVDVQCCGFYDGRLLQVDTTVNIQPNETFGVSLRHILQNIKQASGSVYINVDSADLSVNFTPDMQVRGQMQYDNISDDLQFSFRYRWEFEPGSELLIVAGEDATYTGPYYKSHLSGLSVRLGKTFRF